MLRVGLTGNIASGKSAVGSIWRRQGGWVVEADDLARRAVEPGSDALRAIATEWGEAVLTGSGELDRAALREIVFRDPAARARLEAIVHPVVKRLRDEEFDRAERAGAALAVADVPLLFEVGMEDEFDVVVLVDAPAAERLRRIVENRGLTEDEAKRMIDAQMPAEAKRERAHLVIDNGGTLAQLEARAEEVWRDLAARAEAAR